MQYLNNLFQTSPRVAGWIAFAGSERADRIAADGVVGNNNAAWQAGTRADYYIEAQRIGYQVVLGGLAGGDLALVDRGLRAIEWGYRPDVMGPASDWSFNRDFGTILGHAAHPRTMFGAASVETVLAIVGDPSTWFGPNAAIYDRAYALRSAIEQSATAYIASGDAVVFRAGCANSSQLVFQATWMQGTYVLTGDATFRVEAKETIRAMMALQRPDGAFGEKIGPDGQRGFDTSYCVQTLRELVAYEEMLPGSGEGSWRTQVRDYITKGANWLLGRIRPDGSIDTTGNSRTAADGAPQEGSFAKGWEIDQTAITLAQYAVAFGRWEELAPVITAVQYHGQEYDHIGDIASPK